MLIILSCIVKLLSEAIPQRIRERRMINLDLTYHILMVLNDINNILQWEGGIKLASSEEQSA